MNTRFYHHDTKVTVFGIGELTDPETRERMREALRRVQGVVKNIKELFKVYRSESSWLAMFTALFTCHHFVAASAAQK